MSLMGKLLIAHPKVPKGTIFHRAVIYLYQDNPEQGSIGVTTHLINMLYSMVDQLHKMR